MQSESMDTSEAEQPMTGALAHEYHALKYENVKDLVKRLWNTGNVGRDGLARVVNQINANSRSQDEAENFRNCRGYIEELIYAYRKARRGYPVTLGATHGVGADVNYLKLGRMRSVQIKYVTSPSKKKVKENLVLAMRQLGGSGGEMPAPGSLRKIRVKAHNNNELGNLSAPEQVEQLLPMINNTPHKANVERIKIVLPRSVGSEDSFKHTFRS